jgi:hypothetical protein
MFNLDKGNAPLDNRTITADRQNTFFKLLAMRDLSPDSEYRLSCVYSTGYEIMSRGERA